MTKETKSNISHWLIKSEPGAYSIDNLKEDKITSWTGIRNYQARNYIRDDFKMGDLCLFYHSSAKSPAEIGIAGVAKVSSRPYLDITAKDKKSEYFEDNLKIDWYTFDIKFVKKFSRLLTLTDIKMDKRLSNMLVIKKGMRLSIQPVSKADFEYIISIR